MASIRESLRDLFLAGALASLTLVSPGVTAGVNLPVLEKGKGEKCVEDTKSMRRNHMDMLKHQRDKTMRHGIRTSKHSLKGCVECHASSKTGSVAASKDDFCASCHTFAGVKLDCWDCHATKPMAKPAQATSPQVSPMMTSVEPGGSKQ
jgi:hypothetical protein